MDDPNLIATHCLLLPIMEILHNFEQSKVKFNVPKSQKKKRVILPIRGNTA
jgi:hypothetical protein